MDRHMQRQKAADSNLFRLSSRLYELLILVYPAQFRQEYGPPMVQVFRDELRDTLHESGKAGAVWLWIHALFDLLITAFKEHYWEIQHMWVNKLIRHSDLAAFFTAAFLPVALLCLIVGSELGFRQSVMWGPITILGIVLPFAMILMALGVFSRLPKNGLAIAAYGLCMVGVAGMILFVSAQAFIDPKVLGATFLTPDLFTRIAVSGLALMGALALSKRYWVVGGVLVAFGGGYLVFDLLNIVSGEAVAFIVVPGLFITMVVVGIWLRRTKTVESDSEPALSRWIGTVTAGLVGMTAVIALVAGIVHSPDPAYTGNHPDEALSASGEAARPAIESYLTIPLPDTSSNLKMVYKTSRHGDFARVFIGFSAPPDDVHDWLKAGVLCFQADLDSIPISNGERFTQHNNPYHPTGNWWWERSSTHTHTFCPEQYMMGIDQSDDSLWPVEIDGWND